MQKSISQHVTFIDQFQVADYFRVPRSSVRVEFDPRYGLQCLLDARTGASLAFRPLHGGCWGIV